MVKSMYRAALKKARVVFFENAANRDLFLNEKIIRVSQACLLNGAGVNYVSRWTGGQPSELVGIYNTMFSSVGHVFHKSTVSSFIDVLFEGLELRSIIGYDEFLREVYGDYMILPPVEARKPTHSCCSAS